MSKFRNLHWRNSNRTCDLGANITLTLESSVLVKGSFFNYIENTWKAGYKHWKNLIFSQYRVILFVLKHYSFWQYGRGRSLWPKFLSPAFHYLWIYFRSLNVVLSPAFHNLWIYFRSLNVVLSPRLPTSKSKSQNSIWPTLSTYEYFIFLFQWIWCFLASLH